MQLAKLTLIALFAISAPACSKDEATQRSAAAAPAQAEQANEAEPTATAAAAAAPAQEAHECGGAKQHQASAEQHEGGGCEQMAQAGEEAECGGAEQREGAGCGDMMKDGAGCNQWDKAAQEVTAREVPEGAVWTSYDVTGMHCGGCERRLQAKLGEIEGVVAVEASAELGKVRVAMAPDAKDSQPQVAARITELGFKVQ